MSKACLGVRETSLNHINLLFPALIPSRELEKSSALLVTLQSADLNESDTQSERYSLCVKLNSPGGYWYNVEKSPLCNWKCMFANGILRFNILITVDCKKRNLRGENRRSLAFEIFKDIYLWKPDKENFRRWAFLLTLYPFLYSKREENFHNKVLKLWHFCSWS